MGKRSVLGYKLVAHVAPSTLDHVDGLEFYSGKEASRSVGGNKQEGMDQGGECNLWGVEEGR